MNRILIDKENVELEKITKKVDVSVVPRKDPFSITKVIINVLKSCDLEIGYNLENNKIDVLINLDKNVEFNLYELKNGVKGKIQYTYNLKDNSKMIVNKFNKADNIKEMIIVNLNGDNSNLNYNFKSICTGKEVYDIVVNHNNPNSVSEIKNNSVNINDGKISFQVSGYVDNGTKNCIINQNNRIINLTDNKCEIRPNLYINEYDTIANHSALIGGFNKDELFYIKCRGINETDAYKLLISGFLLSDLSYKKMIDCIKQSIKEYWG